MAKPSYNSNSKDPMQGDIIPSSPASSIPTNSSTLIPCNNIQPPHDHVSSCCSCSSCCASGWGSLPDDLVGLILDEVLSKYSVYDYIRCAALCKSWFRSTQLRHDDRFYRRFKKKKPLLPLLLIPTIDGSTTHRRLYNIINSSSSSSGLISVPYCKRCCGSSHGWLIFTQETLALTLFNPFTGATIHLPPLLTQKHTIDEIKADREFHHQYEIKKVVLSDDPSSNPDNFEVLVLKYEGRLALFTSTSRKWIYAENYFDYDLGYSMERNDDIIYFKGKFLAVIGGVLGSIEIIYNDQPGVAIRLEPLKGVDEINNVVAWGQSYLAESITGTLLYVEKFIIGSVPPDLIDEDKVDEVGEEPSWKRLFGYFEIDNKVYEYRRIDYHLTSCYRVYELEEEATDDDGIKKFNMLMNSGGEGRGLGDQALFLGFNQPVSVRASDFPGCKPNSIYFTDDNCCFGEPYNQLGPIDFGVYTLGDDHAKPLYMLDPSHTHLPPPIWIVPHPNFNYKLCEINEMT